MHANDFLNPELNDRQHILVVDDDRYIRQLNREILTSHGFEVTVALDGLAAWDELQQNHYDLLITDNDMPGLSGMGLIRRLHEAHLTLPVIMVTGSSPHAELARQPELHVEALLLKPYTLDELLHAVKNVLLMSNSGQAAVQPGLPPPFPAVLPPLE